MARSKAKHDKCPECGRVTVRVSWTSLRRHEECRQSAKLVREGKRQKSRDVRNFFPGRVTDRVVRDWLRETDEFREKNSMVDLVEPIVQRELNELPGEELTVSWKSETDKDEVITACKEAVGLIEPALRKYVLPYEWTVDFGFRTPVLMRNPWDQFDTVLLNGFMDILVRDPATDTWRIYDVKHTADASYWRNSFGQLVFYAYENYVRTGKIPVEVGFFQPLVGERVKRFAITEQHVNALATRVQAMAYEVWAGEDQPRTDAKFCQYCDVKHACVKFKPVVASNGRFQVSLGLDTQPRKE